MTLLRYYLCFLAFPEAQYLRQHLPYPRQNPGPSQSKLGRTIRHFPVVDCSSLKREKGKGKKKTVKKNKTVQRQM
jgi:hypothetical protein